MRHTLSNLGFTLLELLITIAILAILLAVAVPSFTTFIDNRNVKQRASAITDMLNTGRSTALTKGAVSLVCWNQTAANVTLPEPDDGVVLVPRQIVVIDSSEDDADARLVSQTTFPADNFNIVTDVVGGGGATCITFNTQGRSDTAARMAVCKDQGQEVDAITIRLNVTGRTSIQDGNNSGVACV